MPNTSASRSWAVWYNGNISWRSSVNGQWNANGATHRYVLCRDDLPPCQGARRRYGFVNFIMLNPSDSGKMDPLHNDGTVANCEKLARKWGYTKLIVTNLFALIDSTPENLLTHHDSVGLHNNKHLVKVARHASLRVAAWGWGAKGACVYLDRSVWFRHVCDQNRLDLKILGRTQFSQPKHPARLSIQRFQNISSLQGYPYPR